MGGFPRSEPQIASLGGTGIALKGGSLVTLNAAGATRSTIDDGNGTTVSNRAQFTFLNMAGEIGLPLAQIKSVNYAMISTDFGVAATGGASGIQITLPTAANAGAIHWVKKVDAGAGAVTVISGSATNIDGAASLVLPTQYESAFFQWDNNTPMWWVIAASSAVIL